MSPVLPFEMGNGRYIVQAELGHGAHAVVYRAFDSQAQRDVAVKVLRADVVERGIGARFLREIRITSELDHPNIARVRDSGEWEGLPFFVTDLATGASLQARLDREGALPIDDALAIAKDAASGLHYAHQRGVIHRDVKPDNMLLTPTGAVLTDFGIARATGVLIEEAIVTSTGIAVGTLAYMSPEQICAEKNIDGRSDQYSLALVLYEILTGVRPHVSASVDGLRLLRLSGRQHAPRDHRPSIPPAVDAAVLRALAPNPADRFATLADFANALTAATGPAQIVSRRRALVGTLATITVVGALALVSRKWRPAESGAAASQAATDTVRVALIESPGAHEAVAALTAQLRAELSAWARVRVVDVPRATPATPWAELARAGASRAAELTAEPQGRDSVALGVRIREAGTEYAFPPLRMAVANPLSDGVVRRIAARVIGGIAAAPDSAPGLETLAEPAREALDRYLGAWRLLRSGALDSAAAQFRQASASASRFVSAQLWSAQVMQWAHSTAPALWKADAERAATNAGTLTGVDSLNAVALGALAAGDFPRACAAYRAGIARDATSFAAWYGIGECQRLDSIAIRDASSPTGLRFRSNHIDAVRGYMGALERLPSPDLGAMFAAAARINYAKTLFIRSGRVGAGSGPKVSAFPSASGDSVVLWPVSQTEFLNTGTGALPPTYMEAIRRGRASLLRFSERWTERAPRTLAARMWRALALELSGSLTPAAPGAPPRENALDALAAAASLAQTTADSISVAVASTRVRLRVGDFAGAARTADSALANWKDRREASARLLAPLAALLGREEPLAALAGYGVTAGPGAADGLPGWLAERYGRALAAAALGNCTSLRTAIASLDSGFATHFAPNELASRRRDWLAPVARLAIPCLREGASAGLSPSVASDRAIQAWLRGDSRGARVLLDSLADRRRGANAAAVAWDQVYAECWLLAQLGDTLAARGRAEAALHDLSGMSEYTLELVPQAAGLRNGLLLASQLAEAAHDTRSGTEWREMLKQLDRANRR